MRTIISALTIVLLLGATALMAAFFYLSTASFPFNGTIQLPLPSAIGGGLDARVQSELSFAPLRLEAELAGRIAIDAETLNAALPSESYSILESRVASDRIASLLGRLSFVQDSIRIGIKEENAVVSGDFDGRFFVRERMSDIQFELPGSGESVAVGGRIEALIKKPRISKDWKARIDGIDTLLSLDEKTIERLAGKFGNDNEFSQLLSELLNERLATHAQRSGEFELELRTRIASTLEQYAKAGPVRQLRDLEISAVKIDRCPQFEQQTLSWGFAVKVSYAPSSLDKPIELPDIEFAETSCPNNWNPRP